MDNRPERDTPEYRSWRYSCLVRDGFQCQLTGQKGGELEVHHIKRWADWPEGRYMISNGITLSKQSHELVTGREEQYEEQFRRIIEQKKKEKQILQGKKAAAKINEYKWRPINPRVRY